MDKNKNCIDLNTSASVEQCESVSTGGPPTTPQGLRILRVPVVLAERLVSTSLVANIHFPDPVLEIKDIKKKVKIVQCRLLLPSIPAGSPNLFPQRDLNLFLKGFVRKNIQYATPCPNTSSSCVSSEIRSLTVDVPFECVTRIPEGDFVSPFTPPQLPIQNTSEEFDFFRAQELGKGFPEKDEFLSNDLSQFHQVSTQFYNQLPYCELISSRITEWDEAIDREPLPGSGPLKEGTFTTIVEKMFLEFTVKVLQNQQVRVMAD
ncbi:CsxC family protein [Cytobacillus pseudoceanisediminis]|uniref:CsxC family protein n=1 Tax=Cytobacillus pseudoceanisediminis TaxID=3051614 RepID=UPI003C2E3031